MNTKRVVILIYLISVHAALVLILYKSDFIKKTRQYLGYKSTEPGEYYIQSTSFQQRIDRNLPTDTAVFLGDSMIAGLAVNAVTENAVNYGIGGNTSERLLKEASNYSSLDYPRVIIICIGHNDLALNGKMNTIDNLEKLIDGLPGNSKVLVNSVFPIDDEFELTIDGNTTIMNLNRELESLTDRYSNTYFVDNYELFIDDQGSLSDTLHIGDGIHLNVTGYSLWIDQLSTVITTIR